MPVCVYACQTTLEPRAQHFLAYVALPLSALVGQCTFRTLHAIRGYDGLTTFHMALTLSDADKSPAARTQFWQKFAIVQEAISNFMTTLPALQNTGLYGEIPPSSPMAPINSVIFVTHTLAQLAIIQLHNSLATDLPTSYETCLTAAREILRLTQVLTPADYARTTMEVVLSVSRTIPAFFHPYAWGSLISLAYRR